MLLGSLAEPFPWPTISPSAGAHPQVDKLEQLLWDFLQPVLLEGQHSRGSSRLHLLSRHCPVFRVVFQAFSKYRIITIHMGSTSFMAMHMGRSGDYVAG